MINNHALHHYLNQLLEVEKTHDYCPNGLQVEGKEQISKVVTGVTASQALIDAAVDADADAILVHHGYFWKGENPCLTGMKRQRLAKLLTHNINLYAYHLPLDIHPQLGNNAQLAKLLGINVQGALDPLDKRNVSLRGELSDALSGEAFANHITQCLGRAPLHEPADKPIKTLAWCTGGGQGYIESAANQGVDAFISGEASEQTIHTAREMGLHFYAAGHHATERYGAKALGEHLAAELDLTVEFIDIDNPV